MSDWQEYPARISTLGEDTVIRRLLPHRQRRMIGAWCFLDHAGPVQFAKGKGLHIGAHPHIGLQTFTWMLKGEIIHRDSLGNEQAIRQGQVNLMTAGNGISHTEDSHYEGDSLHTAQLWIALPDSHRHCPPRFEHYPDLPTIAVGNDQLTLLVGDYEGVQSPVMVHTPLFGADLYSPDGGNFRLTLNPSFEYGLMILEGDTQLEHSALTGGTLYYQPPGIESLSLIMQPGSRALLLGGEPFQEAIVLWWNFVARSQEELQGAVDDWNSNNEARFGHMLSGSPSAKLKAPTLENVLLKTSPE